MKYRLLAACLWAAGALGAFSCYSDDGPPPGPREQPFRCEQMATCGSCTPVLGCGWCQSGDKGICVSDPHRCARAETFTWTWELAFCPVAPDAGAGDASIPDAASDASAWPDATPASDAASDAAPPDAAHE
jgi:hypothetical protein